MTSLREILPPQGNLSQYGLPVAQALAGRRQASKELGVGYATLKRLLDARLRPSEENKQGTLVAAITFGDGTYYDDIMATLLAKSLNTKS